ncbi:MAG: FKBP-type peptidyl-prolyl cis-trans isomerase [Gemmatimonadota bacterium]
MIGHRALRGLTLRGLTLMSAFGLAGCTGDAGDAEPEPSESTEPSATQPAPDPTEVVVDLRDVPWAVDLEVNLDDMIRQKTGLYLQVLAEGQGPRSSPGDSLQVHYRVWLPNGVLLDASYDHDPPEPLGMILGVDPLIDGWTQGVSSMRVGERRRLAIPYEMAYGRAGRRGSPGVPPYSPLLFEVELVGLKAGELPTQTGNPSN